MHFKNPEILYALFALLIPIFIHLFQLQRFVKIPFTNVKFLKEIELQTRKSSKLKKLLVLASRLLAFTFLIIAFAQPYFSKTNTKKAWNTLIYIDNSLSMKSLGKQGELLKRSIQDVLENLPEKGSFALMTNDDFFTDLDREMLKDYLMQTDYSTKNQNYNSLILKSQQYFQKTPENNHKLLWISDFQNNTNQKIFPKFDKMDVDFVKLNPIVHKNLSIDSVYVSENFTDYKILKIKILNQGEKVESCALSAYQNQIILAKTNISVGENQTLETDLRISGDLKSVKITLDYEDTFPFDNSYFISFHEIEKIPVLILSENPSFLNKIFTEDEFILTEKKVNEASFDLIDKNQLIILNEIKEVPSVLNTKLKEFVTSGGSLTIIPNAENSTEQLNSTLRTLQIGEVLNKQTDSLLITKIHFDQPLLNNVFEKQVSNFQYPAVNTHFSGNFTFAQPVLTFANQEPFISQFKSGEGKVYFVASPLNKNNSNFSSSPLVVPIFYNMGKMSAIPHELAYRLGETQQINIPVILEKDAVLNLVNKDESLIPTQEIHSDYVTIFTDEQPQKTGFYKVMDKDHEIQTLAFNTPKTESVLSYWEDNQLNENQENIHISHDIKDVLSNLADLQNIHSYFKWFLALALLFLLLEIALIKYL